MSGTSGDGIDVAVTQITPAAASGGAGADDAPGVLGAPPTVELVGSVTVPFSTDTRELLFKLFSQQVTLKETCDANATLGGVFGDAVVTALAELGVELSSVDLVASHGQTVGDSSPPMNFTLKRMDLPLKLIRFA